MKLWTSKLIISYIFRGMLKDDPDITTNKRHSPKYKLASNLLRSIDTDNSLMSRPLKNRHRHRPVQGNRTGGYDRNEQRKLRRRLQRLMHLCNEGDEKACKKYHRRQKSNSDLVRSLDRRSSKNRRTKLSKKERKERRKQRKLARKQRRRQLRQQRKQNKRNKRKQKSRQQRSINSNQCRTKYIDSGNCPHCSRTCPRVKQPETGKLKFLSKASVASTV